MIPKWPEHNFILTLWQLDTEYVSGLTFQGWTIGDWMFRVDPFQGHMRIHWYHAPITSPPSSSLNPVFPVVLTKALLYFGLWLFPPPKAFIVLLLLPTTKVVSTQLSFCCSCQYFCSNWFSLPTFHQRFLEKKITSTYDFIGAETAGMRHHPGCRRTEHRTHRYLQIQPYLYLQIQIRNPHRKDPDEDEKNSARSSCQDLRHALCFRFEVLFSFFLLFFHFPWFFWLPPETNQTHTDQPMLRSRFFLHIFTIISPQKSCVGFTRRQTYCMGQLFHKQGNDLKGNLGNNFNSRCTLFHSDPPGWWPVPMLPVGLM